MNVQKVNVYIVSTLTEIHVKGFTIKTSLHSECIYCKQASRHNGWLVSLQYIIDNVIKGSHKIGGPFKGTALSQQVMHS